MAAAIVRRIDHVVAVVRDADAALETYTKRLGFPLAWPVEDHEPWRNSAVWLGDSSLELLTPKSQPAAALFERHLESRGEGLFLLAFEARHFDQAVQELERRQVRFALYASPDAQGERRYRSAFLGRRATPGAQSFLCEYVPPFVPKEGGKGALKVKKLDHVVIATEDLEDAAGKWERNLGLKPDASLERPLGSGFKVARLPIGDAFLELVQPVSDEGRFAEQFRERGEGLFSISIEVEDLEAAVAYLRDKGAQVSAPEPGIWPGSRVARVSHTSTHGVSIQLIERK